jgi:hypothetical protein
MSEAEKRPETGAMKFRGDWPGVFIRGDNALGYAMSLEVILDDAHTLPFYRAKLRALVGLLRSCQVVGPTPPDYCQLAALEKGAHEHGSQPAE